MSDKTQINRPSSPLVRVKSSPNRVKPLADFSETKLKPLNDDLPPALVSTREQRQSVNEYDAVIGSPKPWAGWSQLDNFARPAYSARWFAESCPPRDIDRSARQCGAKPSVRRGCVRLRANQIYCLRLRAFAFSKTSTEDDFGWRSLLLSNQGINRTQSNWN